MKSEEDKLKEFKKLTHDVQNILSTIVNNARLLKQKIESTSPAAKHADVIENNSQRASEIIHEFLSHKKTQKRKINTSTLFDDIASSFVNTVPFDIEFNFIQDETSCSVFGNYTDLYRAILNLLVNAKEAITGTGAITFERKKSTNNKILFSIKDSGCGIPEKIINKIFEARFSTKDKGRESGMGLSIVKEITEDHGGQIEVKSKVGEGTEFIVSLPVFVEDKIEGNNKKILIADDDNSLRESLADLFESYGFTTVQAKDGNEVTDLITKKNEFDLLIIDKKMPKKDGIKCITEIRNKDKNFPIVLVTGVNLDVSELEELETNDGADKIVLKPYDFTYLKEIVEKLIL